MSTTTWTCQRCTFAGNTELMTSCSICDADKDAHAVPSVPLEAADTRVEMDEPANSSIREYAVFDQWSKDFKPSIDKFMAPSAICGYAVLAMAGLVRQRFKYRLHSTQLTRLCKEVLGNMGIVVPRVASCMQIVHGNRQRYITAHKGEFKQEEGEESKYLRDWVANYEISDYLREKKMSNVHFVRHIEHDFASLTHEEKARVDEEAPFREGHDIFMDVNGSLMTEQEWIDSFQGKLESENIMFVVDCLGHFVCAKPVVLLDDGDDGNQDSKQQVDQEQQKGQCVLLVLNSSKALNLRKPVMRALFNMCFNAAAGTYKQGYLSS